MVQRVDYYALLSRAVESLEPDAYAARGAVYDREHKALLKRLISSPAPCTDADIAREERAFRNAIRRIEFPAHEDKGEEPRHEVGEQAPPPRTPRRAAADTAWPRSSRDRVRAQRREQIGEEPPEPPPRPQDLDGPEARAARRRYAPAHQQNGGEARGRPPQLPPQAASDWDEAAPRRPRSLLRATASYLLIMAFVLGAGGAGYFYLVGTINVSWLNEWSGLTEWTGLAATSSARATFYDAAGGNPVEGKATWGTRSEPNGSEGKPDMVVTLDVEIPDPHLAMSLVISRNQEAGAGMSHLIELRFAKPAELPFDGIAKISSIAMKASETEAGDALAGTSVNIAPGQFMFGLLGLPDMVQQNIQRLRGPGWLAINIVFMNGAGYTLAVEKGTAGERAINDALAKWGEAGS